MARMQADYFAAPDGIRSTKQHIFDHTTDKSKCDRYWLFAGPDADRAELVKGTETFEKDSDCLTCWRKYKHPNAPAPVKRAK